MSSATTLGMLSAERELSDAAVAAGVMRPAIALLRNSGIGIPSMAATLLSGLIAKVQKAWSAAIRAGIVSDLVHLIAAGRGFADVAKGAVIALHALVFPRLLDFGDLHSDMYIWSQAVAAGLERQCVPVLRQLAFDPSSEV